MAAASSSTSYLMDDDEDVECPLCLDTLDISDLNFKPCSCGYQICRFCWHHIKENLNGRCPACRKPYDDAAIEFKPMKPEELKRLQAAKKQREREKKDADSLSKRHAANVRVRQRAQVHIQGMTTKIANEDTLPYLKGPEQFGRYGKILKLFFSRRAHPPPGYSIPAPSSNAPNYSPVNVYINYAHPSEAGQCIAAIDGSVTSDGHKLKAIWGTTRYCPAYLRGIKCLNDNCMQAHEPGEEVESNTHPGSSTTGSTYRGELNTHAAARESGTDSGEMRDLKHAWKEQGGSVLTFGAIPQIQQPSSKDTAPALPASASWASRQASTSSTSSSAQPATTSASTSSSSSSAPPPASSSQTSSSSSHAHSSSISSRLPKAQNHPLPPRPPSRTNTSTGSRSGAGTTAEPLRSIQTAPQPHVQPVATDKETGKGKKAEQSEREEATKSDLGEVEDSSAPQVSSDSDAPESSSAPSAGLSLPPGLPVTLSTGPSQRPLTPVSEFDRTLDNFGDGLSFAFNLSGANDAGASEDGEVLPSGLSLSKGKERISQLVMEDGRSTPGSSNPTSRSGSPDNIAGHAHQGAGGLGPVDKEVEEEQLRYAAHFDPFSALGGEAITESPTRSGAASLTASPVAKVLVLPPGLSRVSTSDGRSSSSTPPPGFGGKPPGLGANGAGEDASAGPVAGPGRYRSRFGFARQGSTDKSAGSGGLGASSSVTSIAISDLFKAATAANPTVSNGRMSPGRPDTATSSGSGNVGFSLPAGVFSPLPPANAVLNGHSPLPSSSLPPALSNVALPPPDPSKQSALGKQSLSDLFPGVNLAASFSASSSLPPALVKSLGISLDNLDMSASGLTNGKLPNFAPLTPGQGNSIGNQPLPPPPSSGNASGHSGTASTSTSASSSNSPSVSNSATMPTSNAGPGSISSGGPPPGLGASRQAQQAHAQLAQQAHQAYLAAQQAQREQKEREALQQQQAQQAQQQHQHMHGRPPSAASAGSAGKQPDMYSFMGVTSPPLPGTPGSFSDASRFQDPAIVSYANMNGFGHHHPYAHHGPYQHHGQMGPIPGGHDQPGGQGGNGDFYNRYHPLPTPVQPQQTYNPYIPVGPVGMAGMGRLQAQAMSQAGAFGLLRR